MFPRTLHRLMLVTTTPVVPLFLLATRPAQGQARVGGTFTMTYTQRHPLPVSDAKGHVLIATEAKGTHRSTGATPYMDGAQVRNLETADLMQGSGPHQGYVTFSDGAEERVSKWTGAITTVLGPDRKPVTSFEGTWTKVKGPTGRGTYKGRMTGPDTYLVEWEGEIESSQSSSRR